MSRGRRKHSPAFKAKVALIAPAGRCRTTRSWMVSVVS